MPCAGCGAAYDEAHHPRCRVLVAAEDALARLDAFERLPWWKQWWRRKRHRW